MKLSIVVPVYNVEKYIAKCLNSLLDQNLDANEYEIIVINDGTKDSSVEIVQEIASKNPNIIIFNKENGGISSARNKGIELAKGDYTMFIDSDDYIEPMVLKSLVDECERSNLDILSFNYKTVNENGDFVKFFKIKNLPHGIISGTNFMISNGFAAMVWCYLFRTQFLKDNNLTLKPYRHEDEEFIPRALILCERIKFLDLPIYYYLQHTDSYMNSYTAKNIYDMLSALQDLNKFIEDAIVTDPRAIRYVERRVNHLFFITLKKSVRSKLGMEHIMLEENKRHNITHKWVFPLKEKVKFIMMTITPNFFINYLKFTYFIKNKS